MRRDVTFSSSALPRRLRGERSIPNRNSQDPSGSFCEPQFPIARQAIGSDHYGTTAAPALQLDPEEHKPDYRKEKYCQPEGDSEQGENRRTGFSLPCFGRGFDDRAL